MDNLTKLKSDRFHFLRALFEATGGRQLSPVNMWTLGKQLGFPGDYTEGIVEYLVEESLVQYFALGGEIVITHNGVVQVEQAISKPDQPTKYFPPINIINVQNMVGSQIQQGNDNSTQTGTFSLPDPAVLASFIDELKSKIPELNLDAEKLQELNSEIITVEAQSKSSKPKYTIIKECLKSIRNILEGTAGSIAASALLAKLALFGS
ncbi:Hypothetical protein DEACI_2880 [Acididesulfobacillus acetoxydans]|uniref:Multi-copper enzyme maturation ABC-type transport system permease component-like protein n=1 Tax=Acididesulfobacillus acetoxydans TaxID=1561005 RepID=A0A8S0XYJ0_9FIRM|nr:hypothetical protein [Acididesulfobacillus acetoxydans]CAA7602207.1 Hypothetical protein DEACI_2880 [Acididesulfobacillus acetoxydans]CEJ07575.1 Multi-copper enzyme maturation ABC-type transport system permease component-like protein [Acididesulfobacillus acetoxydans]